MFKPIFLFSGLQILDFYFSYWQFEPSKWVGPNRFEIIDWIVITLAKRSETYATQEEVISENGASSELESEQAGWMFHL